MNARSRALVPLSTEQQAAWRAVAETEAAGCRCLTCDFSCRP